MSLIEPALAASPRDNMCQVEVGRLRYLLAICECRRQPLTDSGVRGGDNTRYQAEISLPVNCRRTGLASARQMSVCPVQWGSLLFSSLRMRRAVSLSISMASFGLTAQFHNWRVIPKYRIASGRPLQDMLRQFCFGGHFPDFTLSTRAVSDRAQPRGEGSG